MKKIIVIIMSSLFLITIFTTIPTIGTYSQPQQSQQQTQQQTMVDDWWTMIRHDATQTGYSTSNGPETGNILWGKNINRLLETSIMTNPLVYDNKLYICAEEYYSDVLGQATVFCFNAETGEQIWCKTVIGPTVMIHFTHGSIIHDDRIYVVSVELKVLPPGFHTRLTILDVNTGKKLEDKYFYEEILGIPLVLNDKIYMKGGEAKENGLAKIYCLNLNGNLLWEKLLPDNIEAWTMAGYNGKLFVSVDDKSGIIYCFDAENGQIIWQTEPYYKDMALAIDNGKLYATCVRDIRCFNVNDGSEIWTFTTGPYNFVKCPAIYNGKVYSAVSRSSDYTRFVYCVDETGVVWTSPALVSYSSSPIVADGKVYIATGDTDESGYVYCIDAETGALKWKDSIPDKGLIAIANGRLHVVTWLATVKTYADNSPPSKPTITGTKNGKVGENYNYKFVSTDPNNDDIKYYIEWGDGTSDETGFHASGTQVTVSHTWSESGEYDIRAKAIDENNAESNWAYLQVTMPHNYNQETENSESQETFGGSGSPVNR